MFGNMNKPAFGAAAPSTSFGFGQNANQANPFGQTSSLFSKPSTGFGTSTTTFGQPATTGLFGASSQPQQTGLFGQTTTSTFGAAPTTQSGFGSNLFGQQPTSTTGLFNTSSTFGQQPKPTFGSFGATQPAQPTAGLFGSPQTQQQPAGGLFGQSAAPAGGGLFGSTPAFGASTQNGTTIKFIPVTATDNMMKNGTTQTINTKHMSITCMKEYEGKSFEELRLEDYVANRKGPQAAAGFGGSSFSMTTPSSTSLFGQPAADPNKTAFGQNTPAFGQTTTPFGQTNTFNLGAQPNQTASPFGAKPTAFGAPTASSSFGFGATNTQPTSSLFGANTAQTQKPFGTATTQSSLFGTTNTAQQSTFGGGLGLTSNANTSGMFGAKPAQAAPLFGAQPAQNTFSFNTPASSQSSLFTPASKSLFGGTTTTPAFGASTGAFGTNTGFSSTFGKPTTAPAFGTTATPNFGSTFGSTTNQNTSIFGNQNQAKPGGLFGNTGSTGLFSSGNTAPAFGQNTTGFGLGQPQQQTSFFGQVQDPSQPPNNWATLTSDPFGDAPHLAGLEPKMAPSGNTVSATDPKVLKALLDASKNVDMSHNAKLKVFPARSARDSLFDSYPKSPQDSSKNPLMDYHKTNCRRLIIKRQPTNENNRSSMGGNILDFLADDKENAQQLSTTTNETNNIVANTKYINPVKLAFSNDESFIDPSINGQTNDLTKEHFNETTEHNGSIPPSDDDQEDPEANLPLNKHPCNVICSRPEYYTLPSLDELTPDENGTCFVQGFTVGRKGYGNVYFPDEMDVSGLNIDELVHFRYREINIYPDDSKKPPVGQGLNRRAQVTLDNIYPKRSGTTTLIKDVAELVQTNFADKLRKVSEMKGARFVDYRPETGSWVFKVDHFSRYGFYDSDEDEEAQNAEGAALKAAQKAAQKSKDSKELEKLRMSEKLGKNGLEVDTFQGETSTNKPLHSTALGLDKDILIDADDYAQDDLLRQSEYVDDMSEAGDYQQIPRETPMGFHFPFAGVKSSKNIQVMKSTLFADEDRSSEDAGSQVSIVKQYLDLGDVPMLPAVPEEETPTPKRPMLRPKIWNVLHDVDSPGCEAYVLPNRCCTDMAMFKGKSFKTCWYKGFEFSVVGDPERESNSELTTKTFDKSPEFDPLKDVLTDSLQVVLDHSQPSKIHGIPTFSIEKRHQYLEKQLEVFKKLSDQYNSKEANYLYHVWTLCKALWSIGDDNVTDRRHLVTQWLKEITKEDLTLRTGPFESTADVLNAIFAHLSTFDTFEAANIAMNNRLPYLSLLIAQLSVPNLTKAYMQEQIENWYNSMADQHISDEMTKVYLLLAGIPTRDNVNIFEDLDWKRALALHLWYICPNESPVEHALELYQKAFEDYAYAARPNPIYQEDKYMEDGPRDLMYHVMMLFKSGIHRLCNVLKPATHTADPLDYRLSFLLLQLFQSFDVGVLEPGELKLICTNFSNQLEHLGHWEWAVFVLLFMEDDCAKKYLVMRILERNLGAECDPETQKTVDILVNDMQVPEEWIYQVKAYKNLHFEKYLEAFHYFSLAGDLVTANDIFMDHVLPNMFINELFEVIQKLIAKISPLDTTNPVNIFYEFIELQEETFTPKIDSVLKLQMKLHSIVEKIPSVPQKTDQQKLCVAELSKRCATLYKELGKKSGSQRYLDAYMDFVEKLVMPPEFKQDEAFYLINKVLDSRVV